MQEFVFHKINEIPRSFRTYWGSYSNVKHGSPYGGYLGSYSRQVGPSRQYKPKAFYDGIGTVGFYPK